MLGGNMVMNMATNSAMYMTEKLVGAFLSTGLKLQIALARSVANKAWWLTKVLSPSKIREIMEMMEGITNELKQIGGIQGGSRKQRYTVKKKCKKHKKKLMNYRRSKKNI